MAIQYKGVQFGAATVTIPAHSPGDLIAIMAYRDGANTAPTLGSGYSSTINGATATVSGSTNAMRIGWKIATSSSEVSGTWTNATGTIAMVYSGVDQTRPFVQFASGAGSGTSFTYNALSGPEFGLGESWVIGFAGLRTSTTSSPTLEPTGMINRLHRYGSDRISGNDTNGNVTWWTQQIVSPGVNTIGWATMTLQLLSSAPQSYVLVIDM